MNLRLLRVDPDRFVFQENCDQHGVMVLTAANDKQAEKLGRTLTGEIEGCKRTQEVCYKFTPELTLEEYEKFEEDGLITC